MNARRRTNENGDLPVGWLDKLVQTGFWGGGGMQGMLFHAEQHEAWGGRVFLLFCKKKMLSNESYV